MIPSQERERETERQRERERERGPTKKEEMSQQSVFEMRCDILQCVQKPSLLLLITSKLSFYEFQI